MAKSDGAAFEDVHPFCLLKFDAFTALGDLLDQNDRLLVSTYCLVLFGVLLGGVAEDFVFLAFFLLSEPGLVTFC